jgi:energy-coupling factor transporter ATP-binding protein EcfA2
MSKKLTAAAGNNLADIFNAFHPLALTEEQKDLYQPTAAVRGGEGYEFKDHLYDIIKMSSSNSRLLVVGHGGCGKSTELRMLTAALHGEGTPSITIEAREDLDLSNFSYIDILMLIVERLTKYARDSKIKVSKKIIAAFDEALSTKITQKYRGREAVAEAEIGASASATLPLLLTFVSNIAASLKISSGYREDLRRAIEPRMPNIINALNALTDEINTAIDKENASAKMVIIIDGLEKCRSDNVKILFRDDISALTAINTHLILACPISIYRSPIANILQGYFDIPAIMPMIKTHHEDSVDNRYDEGIAVIKELILKRVEETFFEKDVLDKIIMMGGGSLRDTCRLVRDSASAAYMRRRTTVDDSSYKYAMNRFATDVFYRAENKDYPMLKKILAGERTPKSDESLSELLYNGVVFEYNGEGWIDVHPLMRHYLKDRMEVLED